MTDEKQDKHLTGYEKTLRSALNMLAYQDNTASALKTKLLKKGYCKDDVEKVLTYLLDKGYLNEERYLERFVLSLASSRLYGKRRLALEVYKKGFDKETATRCLPDIFEKIDFRGNCLILAKKQKKTDRQKLYASLIRYGHTSDDASFAVKEIFSSLDDGDTDTDI